MLPPLDFGPLLDIAAASHRGADGLENQDNFLLIDAHGQAAFLRGQEEVRAHVEGWSAGHARIAVLDGMGGHGNGRQVAEAVVEGLLAMPACDSARELSSRLEQLHARLQQRFDAELPDLRPGTTLTLLELRLGQPALLFHAGDSRLYAIDHGQASAMTVDHVPATAFALAGLLGESEWWQQVHGEHRSQISQAFVLGNAFSNPACLSDTLYELSPLNLPAFLVPLADRRAIELREGASYLLATDGLWSCTDPRAWVEQWPSLLGSAPHAQGKLASLFDAFHAHPPAGLHIDNQTAVLLHVPAHDMTAIPLQPG